MKNDKTLNLTLTYPQFASLALFCADHTDVPELQILNDILQDKLDRLIAHELYSKYKTAPTSEEREKARQEYLAKIGIPESYRW